VTLGPAGKMVILVALTGALAVVIVIAYLEGVELA
jgi:hypothetical protein